MEKVLRDILIKFFIITFLVIIFIVALYIYLPGFLDHLIYGQTPTLPNPNLQYLPQQAYIQTFPPSGIPVQQSTNFDVNQIVTGLIGAAAASGYAKIRGDKTDNKIRETNSAVLQTKAQQVDLAKFTFAANDVAANNLNGTMPNIKLDTLEKDKNEFADQAAKT